VACTYAQKAGTPESQNTLTLNYARVLKSRRQKYKVFIEGLRA